ncbi:hypothetical protein [Metabacillus malikii]|uniref:Uncharacterized protein n=1 Tax=Metabacillus malikii TaxID=1504265 RepID=A0ABT9ZDP3_9BACI|nr:hypothetical protein [Metabacillus malikii]MDQ0230379.1 hypothetical protein [Metabacillus malikii]
MTEIRFLASPRPFEMPEEIDSYNNQSVFKEEWSGFNVYETDVFWYGIVQPIVTLPYLYEVSGIGNKYFWIYLEKYFAEGDIIELYEIPVQNWYESYVQRVLEKPESITINLGNYTYQNASGTYQLNPKKWVEELKHRTLLTEFGVTTIVKY